MHVHAGSEQNANVRGRTMFTSYSVHHSALINVNATFGRAHIAYMYSVHVVPARQHLLIIL